MQFPFHKNGFVFDFNNYEIQKVVRERHIIINAVDRKTSKEVDIIICSNETTNAFSIIANGGAYNNAGISQYLDYPGIVRLIGIQTPLTEEEKNSGRPLTYEWKSYKFDLTGFISVFEHMKYPNCEKLLFTYYKSKGTENTIINPTVISKIIFGVAAIMKYIHSRNVSHGDLILENISLDENLEPHIGHFNSACFVFTEDNIRKDPKNIATGDCQFRAAQFENDVIAFAGLIISMFPDNHRRYKRYLFEFCQKPEIIPIAIWDLMKRCSDEDRTNLPTFEQITEMLRDDKYAIELYGQRTDLQELHEYQNRIDHKLKFDLKKEVLEYEDLRLILT